MNLNIGNSIFPGLNDDQGLMICGYEWGFSEEDQRLFESGEGIFFDKDAVTTFPNKVPAHGDRALSWRYDNRVLKWFSLWGHPLSRVSLGGDFEKSIIQTNWCNTESHKIKENYYHKLTNREQLDNFIRHIERLKPSLILFMGSEMINILQDKFILELFSTIMGSPKAKPHIEQKPFSGRRFKIGFQYFDRCDVVSLPHPSSSRGLSDDYISLFTEEIGRLIAEFKERKSIVA